MNIKNDVKMATSSIRITKICQWGGVEFETQKVSTKYCSHRCANLAYKQAVRDKRVKQAEAETLSIKLEKPIENVKDKEYLSFAQAGNLLGLSRQAVYNMVKAGNLKASKISSRLSFIKRTDIDAMLENKPYKTLHPKDSVPTTEFYTTAEIKEKYGVKESWLYKIAKEHNIKDKEIYKSHNISMEKLESMLLEDGEWHSSILTLLSTAIEPDKLTDYLKIFFAYQKKKGVKSRAVEDVKIHFQNWLSKKLENDKGYGNNEQKQTDPRRGTEIQAASAEDYKHTV